MPVLVVTLPGLRRVVPEVSDDLVEEEDPSFQVDSLVVLGVGLAHVLPICLFLHLTEELLLLQQEVGSHMI